MHMSKCFFCFSAEQCIVYYFVLTAREVSHDRTNLFKWIFTWCCFTQLEASLFMQLSGPLNICILVSLFHALREDNDSPLTYLLCPATQYPAWLSIGLESRVWGLVWVTDNFIASKGPCCQYTCSIWGLVAYPRCHRRVNRG